MRKERPLFSLFLLRSTLRARTFRTASAPLLRARTFRAASAPLLRARTFRAASVPSLCVRSFRAAPAPSPRTRTFRAASATPARIGPAGPCLRQRPPPRGAAAPQCSSFSPTIPTRMRVRQHNARPLQSLRPRQNTGLHAAAPPLPGHAGPPHRPSTPAKASAEQPAATRQGSGTGRTPRTTPPTPTAPCRAPSHAAARGPHGRRFVPRPPRSPAQKKRRATGSPYPWYTPGRPSLVITHHPTRPRGGSGPNLFAPQPVRPPVRTASSSPPPPHARLPA